MTSWMLRRQSEGGAEARMRETWYVREGGREKSICGAFFLFLQGRHPSPCCIFFPPRTFPLPHPLFFFNFRFFFSLVLRARRSQGCMTLKGEERGACVVCRLQNANSKKAVSALFRSALQRGGERRARRERMGDGIHHRERGGSSLHSVDGRAGRALYVLFL